MKFLDIVITSPRTFIRKVWGQDRRICSLILRVKGLSVHCVVIGTAISVRKLESVVLSREVKTQTFSLELMKCKVFHDYKHKHP